MTHDMSHWKVLEDLNISMTRRVSHKLRIGMTHRRSHIDGPGMPGMKGKAYGYW